MPGYELMGKEEREAISQLFDANGGVLFAHGFGGIRKNVFKVREFEASLASHFGVKHVQVVSSGTAALYVALKALGIKQGDEVVTSSFTFVATAEAILMAGARPVFTEVDESLNMDPADFEQRITNRTRVVIPVHMAGAPANMDAIMDVAKKRGIKVLEDAAQCVGGSFKDRYVGTIGDAGIFSFDFAKNMTAGEGGAILTNNTEIFEIAREVHDHGHQYNPTFPRGKDTRRGPGFNFRMTEIQAAIGLAQLGKLDEVVRRQRENKKMMKEMLSGSGINYRHLNDANGDIADTLIYYLGDENSALRTAKALYDGGCTTKNLPDAVDWHFAGTWDHMLTEYRPCSDKWPLTAKRLKSAIAVPINACMSKDEIGCYASIIKNNLK